MKLLSDLVRLVFIIDPYDPCVANKVITGNQMKITWNFNDLKILHTEESKVTKVVVWFKWQYGNVIL